MLFKSMESGSQNAFLYDFNDNEVDCISKALKASVLIVSILCLTIWLIIKSEFPTYKFPFEEFIQLPSPSVQVPDIPCPIDIDNDVP